MSKIDLGILIFGIFLVVIGWNKGFLRTLSGPLALALSIALGNKYFNDTQDMMKSALIFLFGPLVIGVAFWFLLNLIRGASGKEAPPSALSRLLGSFINFSWGMGMLAVSFWAVVVLVDYMPGLEKIRGYLAESYVYSLASPFIHKQTALTQQAQELLAILHDPERMKEFQAMPEFQSFSNNEKVKGVFSDEETRQQLENKDFMKMSVNPNIQALLGDKELFKKLMDLGKIVSSANASTTRPMSGPASPASGSAPEGNEIQHTSYTLEVIQPEN